MRNLTQGCVVVRQGYGGEIIGSRCCIAIDSDGGRLFVSDGSSVDVRYICAVNNPSSRLENKINLKDLGLLQDDAFIVDIHYRSDDLSLFIAVSNGDMLSWTSENQVESIGSIGEGIDGIRWSPDGEILVVFSSGHCNNPTIYLLVCRGSELDFLADFPFSSTQFGEAELITVGWGKKETQFHGSVGKQAATAKITHQSTVLPTDDKKPRIRWIGDGRFFVVSAIDPVSASRGLRVWTREGVLHSTSEVVVGLEHSLDWRPSGNLIVSSQTHKNKHDIIFFERNGLKHGHFTLPYPVNTVQINEILWNSESNILCIWLENLMDQTCHVQLWTMNNYHWYLKQSYYYSSDCKPVAVEWDLTDSNTLHVVTCDGSYTKRSLMSNISCNLYPQSDHEVAVIDGSKLLITPFRIMTVPPPMCAYSLEFPSPVLSVSFCTYENKLAALLSNGELAICKLSCRNALDASALKIDGMKIEASGGTGFSVKCSLPECLLRYQLPETLQMSLSTFHHMSWLDRSHLVFCYCPSDSKKYLTVLKVGDSLNEDSIVKQLEVGPLYAVCCGLNNSSLILQYDDGTLYSLQENDIRVLMLDGGVFHRFPVPCQQMQACSFAGQIAVVGLSSRNRLFVNDIEVATNCTSFAVHDDFLLLTTYSHTIRCINRSTPLNKLSSLSDGKAHVYDETVRRVERGSRIVTCVSDDTKVILQMPRGNLELVNPRALVLSTVRKYIDRLSYKSSFMLMQRHRINMNLLCDHNQKAFLANIPLFVEQLQSVAHLNQFITELHEEDVTKTMYTAFYEQSPNHTSPNAVVKSKVDSVCDAVINFLTQHDFDKYLLSILTAHVKKTRKDVEAALAIIKTLQIADKSKVEDALKYLMFLVDVNELFDVALGTYDFEMVLLVAEKSQKDPKEYLPFLNEVRKLETNYQKYTIDRHLKRYRKALEHIAKCVPEKFSELLQLVKEHNLYIDALNLLPITSQERTEIQLSFADHLKEKNKLEEAGILYAQTDHHKLAYECFLESVSWQAAIISLQKLELSKAEQFGGCKKLAEKLVSRRQFLEASTVYELYSEQPEEAIATLIKGSLWNEALRLINKYRREDFIDTDWKPAVECAQQDMVSCLQRDISDLLAYKQRFHAVLISQKSKADLIGDEYRDVDADIYSDTSSMTGVTAVSSSHSRSTGRTSKNQRKAQRKQWSLKEGSKHEDLALLDEMKKLIVRIDGLRGDVHALLLALVNMDALKLASTLQTVYCNSLATIISSIPEIWSEKIVGSAAILTGEKSTTNSILEAMAKLNSQAGVINPSATQAEIEVKRAPVVSTDSTWKLSMLV